jgi:PKD repeat protein
MRVLARLVAFALAGTATAQLTVVVPNGTVATEGSSSTGYPWGQAAAPCRVQYIYDSSNLTAQGIHSPIVIDHLRWRANGGSTVSGFTYGNVVVQMSTAAVDHLAPSTAFASNHGTDLATVWNGPVTVATPLGTTPNDWYVDLQITPFLYDPASGNDLCFEIAQAGTTNRAFGPAVDCATTGSMTSCVRSPSATATTGIVIQNLGIVCELGYSMAQGLYPAFTASPASGPIGTIVQFTDESYTSDPSGVLAWAWDFDGDGVVDSTVQSPAYTFGAGGLYDVTLAVADGQHGGQFLTKLHYVRIGAVTASFTVAMPTDTLAQFVDTSTGNPTAWAWDFDGDGFIDSTAQSPAFQYPADGAYNVSLTVGNAFSSDRTSFGVGIRVLPIPPFASTYTVPITRGLWFQAPTRFSITAIQVPDESNHGLQNVAVYRMANAPPAYSSSTSGGLEFVAIGQPSSSPLPCALSFDAGEYVGVLAACGDAASLRTSLAGMVAGTSGTVPSSILGQPLTLTQLVSQSNLVSSQGNAAYSSEVLGPVGRVQLAISSCVGIPYGSGSPSSTAAAPALQTTALPFLGSTAQLTVTNHDAQALGLVAVGIGRTNLATPFGTILVANLVGAATLHGGAPMTPGQYTYSFGVPNAPSLQGFGPINWQAANLIVSSGEVALSNGCEWWFAQ